MGQRQSRSKDSEIFIEQSGVHITRGLLEQLARKREGREAAGGGDGGTAQAHRGEDAAAAAAASQDPSLARALERSRRVGGLLLTAEGEELQRIDALAEELIGSEYVVPSKPRPCSQQADDCVRCYADHASDPLACAAAVEAYSACAKAAWQEAMQRSGGV